MTKSALHSMATANLNKIEDFGTNTTAASKYIHNQHKLKSHLFMFKTFKNTNAVVFITKSSLLFKLAVAIL